MSPQDVLDFWFKEAAGKWFVKDEQFDKTIRDRFLDTYTRIVRRETKSWSEIPEGRLAQIIVLDQFSRNMFRGEPHAFAHDQLAFKLAEEAVQAGDDKRLAPGHRQFMYMPYMHSESREVHKKAWWLFLWLALSTGNWGSFLYELKHKKIIDRFGRYPHRNEVLGRTSTPEEVGFLKTNTGF